MRAVPARWAIVQLRVKAVSHGGEIVVGVAEVPVPAVAVVHTQREILREPSRECSLERVIFAVGSIIGEVNIGVATEISSGWPNAVGGSCSPAGCGTQRELVQIHYVLQMTGLVADVGHIQAELPRQLMLHTETPREGRGDL